MGSKLICFWLLLSILTISVHICNGKWKWNLVHHPYFGRDIPNGSELPYKKYTFYPPTQATTEIYEMTVETTETGTTVDLDYLYSVWKWKKDNPGKAIDSTTITTLVIRRTTPKKIVRQLRVDEDDPRKSIVNVPYFIPSDLSCNSRYNDSPLCYDKILATTNTEDNMVYKHVTEHKEGVLWVFSKTITEHLEPKPLVHKTGYLSTYFECVNNKFVKKLHRSNPDLHPYCKDCWDYDKKDSQCDELKAGCGSEVAQLYEKDYSGSLSETCKHWLHDPNLINEWCKDPAQATQMLCVDCQDPKYKDQVPFCHQLECYIGGKDFEQGYLCRSFQPNCTNPLHKEEIECLDCEGVNQMHPVCRGRDCHRKGKDRSKPICKSWLADCNNEADLEEDICLDCKGKDKGNVNCKRGEVDFNCDKEDAKLDICYYSTTEPSIDPNVETTTSAGSSDTSAGSSTQHDWDKLPDFGPGDVNETNPFLGPKHRYPEYFTTITVPVFSAIAVTCLVLFILLHMPRCCFGWFREPDWDSYGQPKPESEPEEDQLHRTIV